jgi:NADH-quinone oxidoreductase subunit B
LAVTAIDTPWAPAEARTYAVADRPEIHVSVANLGLACCAAEFGSAVTRGLLEPVGTPVEPEITVLVVSGTLTHQLTPSLLAAWDAVVGPRAVLALGACATSGGPYWDSYAVVEGIDSVVPVASYVPGCPPRPEALVAAIVALAGAS